MIAVYDLGNIAEWVSAVGTVSAVIVALFLARKEVKPKAKVFVSFQYIVSHENNISDNPINYAIDIVNIGRVSIHLQECSVEIKKFFKKSNHKLTFFDGSGNIDKILSPGESYSTTLPYKEVEIGINNNRKAFDRHYIYFKDATGKKYKIKIKIQKNFK